MIEQSNSASTFIEGDQERGLVISSFESRRHQLSIDKQTIQLEQIVSQANNQVKKLSLIFKMSAPVRFSVEILIAEEVLNACVLLNNQVMIMPFAPDWPEEVEALNFSACQKEGSAVSTIVPGQFQKINFRWQDGDILEIFILEKQ